MAGTHKLHNHPRREDILAAAQELADEGISPKMAGMEIGRLAGFTAAAFTNWCNAGLIPAYEHEDWKRRRDQLVASVVRKHLE